MSRIILFTGKGGVGKTTIAAATGLAAAQCGYRSVVVSTDAAHSLGDSLNLSLGPEPELVAPNLWALETNVLHSIEKYWDTVRRWVGALLIWRGVDDVVAEEMTALPGMDELANLVWVYNAQLQNDYDAVIIDCAPTGESLRLLTAPEVSDWWIRKMLPVGRRLAPAAYPLIKRLTDMPLPDQEIFEDADDLFDMLKGLKDILTNPDITSIRLVMNPEKMVIKESQRAYTYLNLFGYSTDCVVCNRVIPEEADGSYWQLWKEIQRGNMRLIEECFSPLPILQVPLLKHEVFGVDRLEEVAGYLYQGDPVQPLFRGKPITVISDNGGYQLRLHLPFVSRGDVSLMKSGDEMVITIGNQRRNVVLPRVLVNREPKGAKLEGGILSVAFD